MLFKIDKDQTKTVKFGGTITDTSSKEVNNKSWDSAETIIAVPVNVLVPSRCMTVKTQKIWA